MKKFMPIILLFILFSIAVLINVTKPIISLNYNTIGVWWWNNKLDDSYIDFAKDNGVTEIYYYTSTFDNKTEKFITNAKSKNIKVYWLTGEYEWIEDDSELIGLISNFLYFQNNSKFIFDGIHFDIEPHQHPDFEEQREKILKKFLNLVVKIRKNFPSLFIEFDIPCWLDDIIEFDGQKLELYKHIINYSNRVTLMSYRDSSDNIYNFAKDEIIYAQSINKSINLGVETQNVNDDNVTFYEEGNKFMLSELNKLKKAIPENFGIAIHHIASWKNLK